MTIKELIEDGRQRFKKFIELELKKEICPDCNGSKKITLFTFIVNCKTCKYNISKTWLKSNGYIK